MKLAIATICPHVFYDGAWWSYEPFVREMNVWASLFEQLIFVAPVENGPPPPFWVRYDDSSRVRVIPYSTDRGRGLDQAPTPVWAVFPMVGALMRAAWRADAIHVRCPGSIGLVATFIAPLLSRRTCAKYAGQWAAYPGEPLSYRIQRRVLRSRWWRGPVTVYGGPVRQASHVVPFFTSVLTREQLNRASQAAVRAKSWVPLNILYVGRLTVSKNVDTLLAAVEALVQRGISVRCVIVGDGPMRESARAQVAAAGLADVVEFAGALPLSGVLDYYERSDVLVLASQTEGWPKAIAEGMAFGLVCVGSDRGLVSTMLGEERGVLVPPGDPSALTAALARIAERPREENDAMRRRAAKWAQGYSLESLESELAALLSKAWGVPIVASHR